MESEISYPPSTVIAWPCTKLALVEQRNSAASATSYGCPMRFMGAISAKGKMASLSSCLVMMNGVSMTPGQMQLTLMPWAE